MLQNVKNKGSTKYVKLANEIYQKTKSLLGE